MRSRTRLLTFADFALQAQGVALDGTLQALRDFLEAHEDLVALVHQDLVRRLKHPRTGREGLDAIQVLRAFVLQRIKAWDLRELRERIADGYTLRLFTTFDARPVPKTNDRPRRPGSRWIEPDPVSWIVNCFRDHGSHRSRFSKATGDR